MNTDLAAAFRRDGFVRVEGIVADRVAALRDAVDRCSVVDAGPSSYGVLVHDVWRREPILAATLLDGALPAAVAAALGLDVVTLFQDHVVNKVPGTTEPVRWHQDYSYWPLAAPIGVTCWVALDDADPDNGCLHYVGGTHRLGERAPADFVVDATQPERPHLPPIDLDRCAREATPVAVRAGDAILHDPLVWHFSPGNASKRPRRAWTSSWVTPDARWAPEHAPHPYRWTLQPVDGAPLDPERFPRVDRRGAARAALP
jgi:phytanoyl-CoA hydroxylase